MHHRYIHAESHPGAAGTRPASGSACFPKEEHMSVVTTQPEMLTSAVPTRSNAGLRAGGSHGHPGDGAGIDGDRRVERRRSSRSGDSPMDVLTRLPAVVVLERAN